jgi:hypothetical protein
LRFTVLLTLLTTLLAWPFPWLGRAFRRAACSAVNEVILYAPDAPDVARLVPITTNSSPGFDWRATLVVWNQPSQSIRFKMDVDLHHAAYVPLALFVALTFAGACTLGRREFPPLRILLGIALLLLRSSLSFVLLRRQADGLPHEAPLDIALQIANLAVGAPLGMAYAFPLLLWLFLFRRALHRRWTTPGKVDLAPERDLTTPNGQNR